MCTCVFSSTSTVCLRWAGLGLGSGALCDGEGCSRLNTLDTPPGTDVSAGLGCMDAICSRDMNTGSRTGLGDEGLNRILLNVVSDHLVLSNQTVLYLPAHGGWIGRFSMVGWWAANLSLRSGLGHLRLGVVVNL